MFDVGITVTFGLLAYLMRKLVPADAEPEIWEGDGAGVGASGIGGPR